MSITGTGQGSVQGFGAGEVQGARGPEVGERRAAAGEGTAHHPIHDLLRDPSGPPTLDRDVQAAIARAIPGYKVEGSEEAAPVWILTPRSGKGPELSVEISPEGRLQLNRLDGPGGSVSRPAPGLPDVAPGTVEKFAGEIEKGVRSLAGEMFPKGGKKPAAGAAGGAGAARLPAGARGSGAVRAASIARATSPRSNAPVPQFPGTWDARESTFKDPSGDPLPWTMIAEPPAGTRDGLSRAAVATRGLDRVFTASFGGIAGFQGRIEAEYGRTGPAPTPPPKLSWDAASSGYRTPAGDVLPTFTAIDGSGMPDGLTLRIAYDKANDRFLSVSEGGLAGLRSQVSGVFEKGAARPDSF